MADFNITDPEITKMLDGLTEEGRQDVADHLQESLDSGEIKKIIEDTKGNHSTTSEDSLLRGSNNELTELHTKQIIDTYGEDEWFAVAQMSYQQVVDFYLAHRRQAKIRETKDTWEQKYNELFEMTKKHIARAHERGHTISEMREEIEQLKKEKLDLKIDLNNTYFNENGGVLK